MRRKTGSYADYLRDLGENLPHRILINGEAVEIDQTIVRRSFSVIVTRDLRPVLIKPGQRNIEWETAQT